MNHQLAILQQLSAKIIEPNAHTLQAGGIHEPPLVTLSEALEVNSLYDNSAGGTVIQRDRIKSMRDPGDRRPSTTFI